MAHKIAQARQAEKENEHISLSMTENAHTKKIRLVYAFFAVIIATAFISSAITLTISASGPTGFGTVIEPGSQVIAPSYVIFQSDGTNYVRNGTSGEITQSASNFSALLMSLLSEANGDRKIIHINEGTYLVTQSITYTLLNNVTIEGNGYGTCLQASSTLIGDMIYINNIAKCEIKDLRLDANSDARVASSGYDTLLINNPRDLTIKNLWIDDSIDVGLFIQGTYTNGCYDVRIADCQFRTCGGSAIHIGSNAYGQVHDIRIQSCDVYNFGATYPEDAGILVGLATDVLVEGCKISDKASYHDLGAGIRVNWGQYLAQESNVIITNNICTNIAGQGILSQNTKGVQIHDNSLTNNGGCGIYVEVWGYALVSSNLCSWNDWHGISVVGSSALPLPNGTLIEANICAYNGERGITTDTTHSMIVGNLVYNNGQNLSINVTYPYRVAGILTFGSYSIISGNLCFDNQTTKTQTYGFSDYNAIGNRGSYNLISDNDFRGNWYAAIINGTSETARNNLGYLTDNKGTATITTSTSVVFNHGLATTPTLVLASFNLASYGNYTWTATTTQITITVSTSGTYTVYWYAEV